MIARVYVPGKYLADVVVGQRAEVESHFLQGRSFEGQVKRISPVVDPNSGTFKVTVGLGDEWRDLRPGVFVNVRIVTDTHRNAVLLPKQAVVYDGGERYVFVVADSTATRVKLDAGFEDNHYVEALSLIAPRVPIIVVGQNGLRDSSLVKVMNAVSGRPAARPRRVGGHFCGRLVRRRLHRRELQPGITRFPDTRSPQGGRWPSSWWSWRCASSAGCRISGCHSISCPRSPTPHSTYAPSTRERRPKRWRVSYRDHSSSSSASSLTW